LQVKSTNVLPISWMMNGMFRGPVRLERRVITLPDGHRVGVAMGGRGMPFVLVHGFGTEARVYSESLTRIAALGFRVVAIDAAGHGSTPHIPGDEATLDDVADLVARTLDDLGIKRAVLAGHSMGGRLVAEVAAKDPDRAIALILIDAILGEPWDRRLRALVESPQRHARFLADFALDSISTVPFDLARLVALGRRSARSVATHVTRPWLSVRAGWAVVRARPSVETLADLARARVPVVHVHGDRDLIVPLASARDAAMRSRGDLVVIEGARHSWLLRCHETLPSVVADLMHTTLGAACARALGDAGLDSRRATIEDVERACYVPGARVLTLNRQADHTRLRKGGTPLYRWRRSTPHPSSFA
jgi:pimeloyl-ACP methyl ester carboxylesterase